MFAHRDLIHNLLFERHAALGAGQFLEELVVISSAPAQPATLEVECYSWNQDQIQPVHRKPCASAERFANAEPSSLKVGGRINDLASLIASRRSHKSGQRNSLADG